MAEDWEGLRKAVLDSPLSERGAIMYAIEKLHDSGQRKAEIQRIAGGRVWRIFPAPAPE